MKKIFILILLIFIQSLIFAALSPQMLAKMQEESEEHLEIKVTSVTQTFNDKRIIEVEVRAKILNIIHSECNLAVGDSIYIKYNNHKTSGVADEGVSWNIYGPAPVPILKVNIKYPAFLKRTENDIFVPTAGGVSFRDKIILTN